MPGALGHDETLMRVSGRPFRWIGNEVRVLRDERKVTTLGGAAALVWDVTAEPVLRSRIPTLVRATAPAPMAASEDLETWVDEAVEGMVASGLLVDAHDAGGHDTHDTDDTGGGNAPEAPEGTARGAGAAR